MRTDRYDVVSITTAANDLGLVQEMFAAEPPSLSNFLHSLHLYCHIESIIESIRPDIRLCRTY